MKGVIFLVLLCIISSISVFSQSCVSGYVYTDNEADSLVALKKVKVVLESKNIKKSSRTDVFGFYSIKLDAMMDTIHVDFIRKKYIPLEVEFLPDTLTKNKRIDITLRRLYSLHDEEYNGESEVFLLIK